jgi:hypothetical protein
MSRIKTTRPRPPLGHKPHPRLAAQLLDRQAHRLQEMRDRHHTKEHDSGHDRRHRHDQGSETMNIQLETSIMSTPPRGASCYTRSVSMSAESAGGCCRVLAPTMFMTEASLVQIQSPLRAVSDPCSTCDWPGSKARFAQLAELGAGGHAVSNLDVAELPVDVPRNETD